MPQERTSTNDPFVKPDGSMIFPGEWIQVEMSSNGIVVGRFSGVWQHPKFGRMCTLRYPKHAEDGAKVGDFYWAIDNPKAQAALNKAFVIEKPTKRKGKLVIVPVVPSGAILH